MLNVRSGKVKMVVAGAGAVAACMSAVAVVTAGPANASAAVYSDCLSNYLCLYDNTNFGNGPRDPGGRVATYYIPFKSECVEVDRPGESYINDKTSSIWNNSNKGITFYINTGCQGAGFSMASYTKMDTVPNIPKYMNFNDKITSFRIAT